jgi:hypothetical protein
MMRCVRSAFFSRLSLSIGHPVPDFHAELGYRNAKSPASPWGRPGFILLVKGYQPRVRERIMKLSKVYSATCHHRYWSER